MHNAVCPILSKRDKKWACLCISQSLSAAASTEFFSLCFDYSICLAGNEMHLPCHATEHYEAASTRRLWNYPPSFNYSQPIRTRRESQWQATRQNQTCTIGLRAYSVLLTVLLHTIEDSINGKMLFDSRWLWLRLNDYFIIDCGETLLPVECRWWAHGTWS